MVYTVTFNPAVDYLVYLSDIRIGEIQRADSEAYYFSGKGINVSKVLHTLGIPNVATGFLAGFTGRAIADALEAEGIEQDFCFLPSGNTRINVKIRHGKETDLNCCGPVIPASSLYALYEKLDRLCDDDILILSGSVPKSVPKAVYAEVLRRVSRTGVLTVVDADGELLQNALPQCPFLIKPNREELSALLHTPMECDATLLFGAKELQHRGARNVLISLGGDGAMLCTEDGAVYRIGAAVGQCVNSIGAGDSMLAGFLAGYLTHGGDFTEALRLGTAAGAASAFSEGLGTKEQIEKLLLGIPKPQRIVGL